MSLSTLGSDTQVRSSVFDRLHPRVQRWVYDQGWDSLHDVQERAAPPVLSGSRDVIVSAATAAGKTEAAFLPILSVLLEERDATGVSVSDPWEGHDPWEDPSVPEASGVQVLYLSPLKALINDQFTRLEGMCSHTKVPVHRWHGDVSRSAKQRVFKKPEGVLLITPESLEATFMNRGSHIGRLFRGLRYVVVDELHSFLGTARGAQVQSLMHRLEVAVGSCVPRVGLSATLGDLGLAAKFLRPDRSGEVELVKVEGEGSGLRLQVRGYTEPPAPDGSSSGHGRGPSAADEIADHMFWVLRGQDNLVFSNSRAGCELFSDLLTRRSKKERVPNEFWPHHGSLSKGLRETVEKNLKDSTRPATAVCTSTLEMGIDVGSVGSVAQIGVPPSVAGLRQRVGRSGRRDRPAVLRVYVTEQDPSDRVGVEELCPGLVQTVATVRLMLDRWIESPSDPGFNYSTLVQQTLSMIVQHGGVSPVDLFNVLCGSGPFRLVDRSRYVRLLRSLADADLVSQTADGLLLCGVRGERFVNHYSFYSAFQTADEWKLVSSGRTLGTVPFVHPLYEGLMLIFAGRRWRVLNVDEEVRTVELVPASGGKPPRFSGTKGSSASREVREEMRRVYESEDMPVWLDKRGQRILGEARAAYHRRRLRDRCWWQTGEDVLVLPWVSDRGLFTAGLMLRGVGLKADVEGVALRVAKVSVTELGEKIRGLLEGEAPDVGGLAALVENPVIDKWDRFLGKGLVRESASVRMLDRAEAWEMFSNVLPSLDVNHPSERTQLLPDYQDRTTDQRQKPERELV